MGGMMENPNFVGLTPMQPQYVSAHAVSAAPVPQPIPAPVPPQATESFPSTVSPETPETDIKTVKETSTANTENATGDLLKNKVNSLLRSVDDDTDEFLESLPTKKKRFGFFRK